jgi:hypothetical protein
VSWTTDKAETPAERKAFLIYYAGVLLREARARRGQNVDWMIAGAARARREAAGIDLSPSQADLFA